LFSSSSTSDTFDTFVPPTEPEEDAIAAAIVFPRSRYSLDTDGGREGSNSICAQTKATHAVIDHYFFASLSFFSYHHLPVQRPSILALDYFHVEPASGKVRVLLLPSACPYFYYGGAGLPIVRLSSMRHLAFYAMTLFTR
jgi:hypothetical protein